jgi:hypothetical protein
MDAEGGIKRSNALASTSARQLARKSIHSICPPDGRTPSGGQEGRLGLTALSADSEKPHP